MFLLPCQDGSSNSGWRGSSVTCCQGAAWAWPLPEPVNPHPATQKKKEKKRERFTVPVLAGLVLKNLNHIFFCLWFEYITSKDSQLDEGSKLLWSLWGQSGSLVSPKCLKYRRLLPKRMNTLQTSTKSVQACLFSLPPFCEYN